MVTEPYLIAEVLSKDTEIEKSIEGVYSKFNVVSWLIPQLHSLPAMHQATSAAAAAARQRQAKHLHVAHG